MNARFISIAELTGPPPVVVVVDVMRPKSLHPDWVTLKDGPPAPGFDAVNSPGALRAADLSGRTVVQKTTYGTTGALAARDASLVLCASFVVAGATARLL